MRFYTGSYTRMGGPGVGVIGIDGQHVLHTRQRRVAAAGEQQQLDLPAQVLLVQRVHHWHSATPIFRQCWMRSAVTTIQVKASKKNATRGRWRSSTMLRGVMSRARRTKGRPTCASSW